MLKRYGTNLDARDSGKAAPIHHAAYFGNFNLVRWLVEAGANTAGKDKNGRLPKDVAKRYGHHEVHRYLKEAGNKKNNNLVCCFSTVMRVIGMTKHTTS